MRRLVLFALVPVLAACGGRHGYVLQLPYPVADLSADGPRVAVAPAPHSAQLSGLHTPPIVLWSPVTGRRDRFRARGCAQPNDVTVAGDRTAFVCDNSCCDSVDQDVTVVEPGKPRAVLFRALVIFPWAA